MSEYPNVARLLAHDNRAEERMSVFQQVPFFRERSDLVKEAKSEVKGTAVAKPLKEYTESFFHDGTPKGVGKFYKRKARLLDALADKEGEDVKG